MLAPCFAIDAASFSPDAAGEMSRRRHVAAPPFRYAPAMPLLPIDYYAAAAATTFADIFDYAIFFFFFA